MNFCIKILFMVIFFSSCSLIDKKKYNSSSLEELYFNENILNKNYIGKTKEQIIYMFGIPIISDSFNDAYHYCLYDKNHNNSFQKVMLNLYFKDNKVLNFDIK